MKVIKRIRLTRQESDEQTLPFEDRVGLTSVSFAGEGRSMIWMPDGNIYIFEDGVTYRLEVIEE